MEQVLEQKRAGLEGLEALAGRWAGAQRGMLFLWVPVFMGAGIAGYFSLGHEPDARWTLAVCIAAVALAAGLFKARARSGVMAVLFGLAVLTGAASVGFGLAQARTMHLAAPVLTQEIGPVWVDGVVESVAPLEEGKGFRVLLSHLSIEGLGMEETPRMVRVKVREAQGLRPGVTVHVLAGLNPPSAPVAPHAFDFQFDAWFKQIGAFGFAYRDPEITGDAGAGSLAQRMRMGIDARIRAHLEGARAAMAIAFTTGEVSGVSEGDWDSMRASGLAHMLAISGSHVVLVAGFVFFAVRLGLSLWTRAALYWPIKRIAAGVALVAVTFFVYIVGPLVPVLRALVMTDIVLLGVMTDRVSISMRLLAIAGIVLMAWMPEIMLGASFQMSYAAVAALVIFYEATKDWWVRVYREAGWIGRAGLYMLGVCVTSFIAEGATSSFALYNFQQFPVYGLFANMAAEPFMSFIVMPAVILVLLGMPFHLEGIGLRIMDLGDRIILWISDKAASMPHAVLHFHAWPPVALALIVASAPFALLLRGPARWTAAPLLAIGILAAASYRTPEVYVAPSGKLFAVAKADGTLELSSLVADKFAAENWMRMAGHEGEDAARWPKEGIDADGVGCDEAGCRFVKGEHKIAFPRTEEAMAEDCAWADAVVTGMTMRVPCAARVIDRTALIENGAYTIGEGGEVISVQDVRGSRPWAVSNARE